MIEGQNLPFRILKMNKFLLFIFEKKIRIFAIGHRTRILSTFLIPNMSKVSVRTSQYLQVSTYKSVRTSQCVQVSTYKSVLTSQYVQVSMYKSVCTSQYVQVSTYKSVLTSRLKEEEGLRLQTNCEHMY